MIKPSSIIIVLSILFVVFIGYQNDIVQRFFTDYEMSEQTFEKVSSDTTTFPAAAGEEESPEEAPIVMSPRLESSGRAATRESSDRVQIFKLQHRIDLLEYRVKDLEEDYQIVSDAVKKKTRKFDDMLALLGTIMPLIVTYMTFRNKEKVDNAGKNFRKMFSKSVDK